MLTPKREKFVLGLIDCKSQREAYRIAYPKSVNWTDKTVDSKASELFKNGEVKERFNELRAKCESKAIWTREQAINDLVSIKNECVSAMLGKEVNEGTGEENTFVNSKVAGVAINAIKELNIMNGYNENNVNMKIDKVVVSDDLQG